MSNEPTPPATPPEQPPVVPESIINADGTFSENWQTLAPEGYEDLHDDKSLPRSKNIWEFAKTHVNLRKQVPMDKMPRPNEKFTESDWDEYYKAGGRPDTKEDYNIKYSEEVPEQYRPSKEVTERFQEIFHKYGASKKLADALTSLNEELVLAEIAKDAQDRQELSDSIHDGLRKIWGPAYEQNIQRGEMVIDKDKDIEEDPAYYARLVDTIKKNPDLIRHESNIGSLFTEHKIWEDPGIPSPGDLLERIAELEKSPDMNSTDKRTRMNAVDKIMRLRKQLTKGAVI